MTFHIITIFPEIFNSYFNESMIKRARETGKIKINIYNLRDWTNDKHKTVDDAPYGGGAGMIMKADILCRALKDIKNKIIQKQKPQIKNRSLKTVLTSAKGKTWNQDLAQDYAKLTDIIIICGRYEGVDERITNFIDDEISIGDYVLTGGEIPAMAIVDSTTRLLPGVLGNPESLEEESFNANKEINYKSKIPGQLKAGGAGKNQKLEYPQYTRPKTFIDGNGKKYRVPEILLSGNHEQIKKWRQGQSRKIS